MGLVLGLYHVLLDQPEGYLDHSIKKVGVRVLTTKVRVRVRVRVEFVLGLGVEFRVGVRGLG